MTARHKPPSRPPIRIAAGEQVVAGERDTEWPAFVFVTTESGAGWVPSRHLSGDSGPVQVVRDYDTTELAAEPGDALTVLTRDDEGSWLWCRDQHGRQGWIPLRAVSESGGDAPS